MAKKDKIEQPKQQLCKRCWSRLTIVEDVATGKEKLWCFKCESQLLGRN